MQAAAIGIGLFRPTLAGLAAGSLLLGIPFTAISFFALQEARRLRPESAASYMGLLTATYSVGQVIGPPLAAALLHRRADAGDGFALSLGIAAASLGSGAVICLGMVWRYPLAER